MAESKFIEGKSFKTIPPIDYSIFEMINENVQQGPQLRRGRAALFRGCLNTNPNQSPNNASAPLRGSRDARSRPYLQLPRRAPDSPEERSPALRALSAFHSGLPACSPCRTGCSFL
jgi:hypothetical protein